MQRLDAIVERLLAGVARRMAEEKDATGAAPVAVAQGGKRRGNGTNASTTGGAAGFSNRLGDASRRRGVRAPEQKVDGAHKGFVTATEKPR